MKWLTRFPSTVWRAARRLMRRRWFAPLAVAVLVLLGAAYAYLQAPVLWFIRLDPPTIPVSQNDERILVIAPHPDDDVLAAGGTMAEAEVRGASVLVVYLTSGDANQAGKRLITMTPFLSASSFRALGQRRQKEAILALRRLGLPPEDAIFLNYPDFGLIDLITRHWSASSPYRSRFTRQSATYSRVAFDSGAAYCGENVLSDLVAIIEAYRPTAVYVPHPSDTHPDHRAGYYFAVLAIQTALADDPGAAPHEVQCYLTHASQRPWPTPRGVSVTRRLDFPPALLNLDTWESVPLQAWSVREKLDAIRAHFSQWWASGSTLASFARSNEVFMVVSVEPYAAVPHWPEAQAPGSV